MHTDKRKTKEGILVLKKGILISLLTILFLTACGTKDEAGKNSSEGSFSQAEKETAIETTIDDTEYKEATLLKPSNYTKIKVYSEPSADSTIMQELDINDVVLVSEETDDYYKVDIGGTDAYVLKEDTSEDNIIKQDISVPNYTDEELEERAELIEQIRSECEHEFSDWDWYFVPTCEVSGMKFRVCEKCGETEYEMCEERHHFFEYVIVREPSDAQVGIEEYRCRECGYVESTREIFPPLH